MTVPTPKLTVERRLLREHALVIACDEVGRGALAGPVAVGAAVVDARLSRSRVPEGLRDSKLVAEARRPLVARRVAGWVPASAVGWASAAEIDDVGIMRALGLAALRAIEGLLAAGVDAEGAVVILDGNHDYITPAGGTLPVRPIIKADRDCAGAAAASVLAKVARDELMVEMHEELPVYQWARNKGYGSLDHRDAIRDHGLSRHHRASWAISAAAAADTLTFSV
ncbi:ribonuclease HII [Microbacterium invictum]|uniref:Ribonuclease n=1 Tax=Microbacterium invictum TaxID=515415 RepID=A0AA40VKZ7_9MICO|nr:MULTISPECIES: ribonuclease HII [Microbacterium]MBB4138959.1 ribonuclease HII [Microbacterium invictum]